MWPYVRAIRREDEWEVRRAGRELNKKPKKNPNKEEVPGSSYSRKD